MRRQKRREQRGFSLHELLVTAALLSILAGLSRELGAELVAQQRVETRTRLLLEGIQKGRTDPERQGQPCGISLTSEGWGPPTDGQLLACQGALGDLSDSPTGGGVQWTSNFPATLRFTGNGLVIDGGTAVVWVGRYGGDPRGAESNNCQRDERF